MTNTTKSSSFHLPSLALGAVIGLVLAVLALPVAVWLTTPSPVVAAPATSVAASAGAEDDVVRCWLADGSDEVEKGPLWAMPAGALKVPCR